METRNVPSALVALVAAMLVVQGNGVATAGEKVFRLKNGRTLLGEIVEERRDAYVVTTKGGGVASLRKDGIRAIEEATAKPAGADTSPVATDQPATRTAPRVVRLASASEVAKARRALVSYAEAAGAGRITRGRALVAEHGVAPFVTLLLERSGASPKEVDAALEIVLLDRTAAAPYVNEAAAIVDATKPVPASLRAAIEAVALELAR